MLSLNTTLATAVGSFAALLFLGSIIGGNDIALSLLVDAAAVVVFVGIPFLLALVDGDHPHGEWYEEWGPIHLHWTYAKQVAIIASCIWTALTLLVLCWSVMSR